MKDQRKKGPAADVQTGPKRKDESERLFDSKVKEIKSQESLLLFLFVENHSKILTDSMIELIWNFMEFLKSNGYHIVNEKEVFCVPFSHLVVAENLK